MSDRNDIIYNSSQEIILFSSQTYESDDDDYQPSTQDIINIHTQEASNASDFFDKLRESQLSVSDSSVSPSNENMIKIQDMTDVSVDSFNDSQPTPEKKKRGRKRKIRTPEEMVVHLKEKKEKNRLAAQRLRQKKGTEVAKHDQEVVQLEANVHAKRQFLELIESNVKQLRSKITKMFGQTLNTPKVDESVQIIKKEIINENDSKTDDRLEVDLKQNRRQFTKFEQKGASDHSKHNHCVSR